jgi:peptide/nickel transport system substrate-binding protein
MDEVTVRMRELAPTQRDEYLDAWFDFQVLFNELLPNLPLYSNQYYDIYNTRIDGVTTTPFWNWSIAIADVTIVG